MNQKFYHLNYFEINNNLRKLGIEPKYNIPQILVLPIKL